MYHHLLLDFPFVHVEWFFHFQVDLSDSENDWASDEEGGVKGGAGPDDVTMGKRRGGELGVNKKGTPLYSREDIR